MSVSSRSTNTDNLGNGSGLLTITEASPALNLPPSSRNFKIYSPIPIFGTIVSFIEPDRAGTTSTAFVKVPLPSLRFDALTTTLPPCNTSTEVVLSKRKRTNWSEIGSILKLVTSSGKAVLPTVVNIVVAGFVLGLPNAL